MMGSEAVDALAHSIAGAGGGCVALAITYPLLTATTRLQIQQVRSLTRDGKPYKNALDAIQRITTEEGWRKLYAGLKAALSGNIVSMGVYYYFYALLMGIAQGTLSFAEDCIVAVWRCGVRVRLTCASRA